MRALALAALAFTATCAHAQTLYRSTMPDGRVVLSDRPIPGARRVEEIAPRTGNVVPALPGAPQAAEDGAARAEELAEARRALVEAMRAREAAREAARKGEEPLPGERTGIAGGGSRLNEAYWERQRALARAVEEAEQRVREAEARVNALR